MAKVKKQTEELPEVDLVMESAEVTTESRKLKTGWEVQTQKPELSEEQKRNMSHQAVAAYYKGK